MPSNPDAFDRVEDALKEKRYSDAVKRANVFVSRKDLEPNMISTAFAVVLDSVPLSSHVSEIVNLLTSHINVLYDITNPKNQNKVSLDFILKRTLNRLEGVDPLMCFEFRRLFDRLFPQDNHTKTVSCVQEIPSPESLEDAVKDFEDAGAVVNQKEYQHLWTTLRSFSDADNLLSLAKDDTSDKWKQFIGAINDLLRELTMSLQPLTASGAIDADKFALPPEQQTHFLPLRSLLASQKSSPAFLLLVLVEIAVATASLLDTAEQKGTGLSRGAKSELTLLQERARKLIKDLLGKDRRDTCPESVLASVSIKNPGSLVVIQPEPFLKHESDIASATSSKTETTADANTENKEKEESGAQNTQSYVLSAMPRSEVRTSLRALPAIDEYIATFHKEHPSDPNDPPAVLEWKKRRTEQSLD